jgi:hypothetical protein
MRSHVRLLLMLTLQAQALHVLLLHPLLLLLLLNVVRLRPRRRMLRTRSSLRGGDRPNGLRRAHS